MSSFLYIGPGLSVATIIIVLVVLLLVLVSVVSIFWIPLKKLIRKLKGGKSDDTK